ncbi:MAG: hypothetical protein ACYCO3_09190 [Mycobacteriales bacterium]
MVPNGLSGGPVDPGRVALAGARERRYPPSFGQAFASPRAPRGKSVAQRDAERLKPYVDVHTIAAPPRRLWSRLGT